MAFNKTMHEAGKKIEQVLSDEDNRKAFVKSMKEAAERLMGTSPTGLLRDEERQQLGKEASNLILGKGGR